MTAVELLAELRNHGATVAVVGDRLRIKAPADLVTPELYAVLRAHKAELVQVVAMQSQLNGDEKICEHVAHDPDLGDWYAENPHLTCARCDLAGAALRCWLQ